jgi:hypothetical protein
LVNGLKEEPVPTGQAIELRDRLNALIETLDQNEQDGLVLRCCLALAVEEVEKWMYQGQFTPSVVPVGSSPSVAVCPKCGHVYAEPVKEVEKGWWSNDPVAKVFTPEMVADFESGLFISVIKGLRTIRNNAGEDSSLKRAKDDADAVRARHPNEFGCRKKDSDPAF